MKTESKVREIMLTAVKKFDLIHTQKKHFHAIC